MTADCKVSVNLSLWHQSITSNNNKNSYKSFTEAFCLTGEITAH